MSENVECPTCKKSTAVLKAQCPHCGESDYTSPDIIDEQNETSENDNDEDDISQDGEKIGKSHDNSYDDEGGPEGEGSYDDEDYDDLSKKKGKKLRF